MIEKGLGLEYIQLKGENSNYKVVTHKMTSD